MTEQPILNNENIDLIESFHSYQLPDAIKEYTRSYGNSVFGSNAFTKMMFWTSSVKLSNEDYNIIMAIKPERQSEETYERYKKRQKLQKFLGKWKPYFYEYASEYDLGAKKRKITARKAKQQLIKTIK